MCASGFPVVTESEQVVVCRTELCNAGLCVACSRPLHVHYFTPPVTTRMIQVYNIALMPRLPRTSCTLMLISHSRVFSHYVTCRDPSFSVMQSLCASVEHATCVRRLLLGSRRSISLVSKPSNGVYHILAGHCEFLFTGTSPQSQTSGFCVPHGNGLGCREHSLRSRRLREAASGARHSMPVRATGRPNALGTVL